MNRERLHSYLVMDLDYINQMILKVYMIKYLDIMLQEFLYHLSITAATPAVDQLFKVRYDSSTQYLPENQAHTFHHTVSQLVFMSSRTGQYIPMAVEFLTTRVKKPYKDDWEKLKQVLK